MDMDKKAMMMYALLVEKNVLKVSVDEEELLWKAFLHLYDLKEEPHYTQMATWVAEISKLAKDTSNHYKDMVKRYAEENQLISDRKRRE